LQQRGDASNAEQTVGKWQLIVGSSFLLLPLLSCIYILSQFPAALRSTSWPSVQGSVEDSKARTDKVNPGKGGWTYFHDFRYSYTVNGVTYTNDTISLVPVHDSTQAEARKYPKGKSVIVYYDPSNPERSALEPGLTTNVLSRVAWVLAAASLIPGIVSYFLLRRPRTLKHASSIEGG
jgi:hypothetical protein